MKEKYDIVFLLDGGIGNVLEGLYAVEYCLANNKRTGFYIRRLSRSFVEYLRASYGPDVVLDSIEGVSTVNLVHSFTYHDEFNIGFDHYFYLQPDALSSKVLSETEQYLSVVRALYPSEHVVGDRLERLTENYSERVRQAEPERKVVLYPGCSAPYSAKRWPYFMELLGRIGTGNALILGGKEDLDFSSSYFYPTWITRSVSQKVLNQRRFYNLLKKLGVLRPHAHSPGMDKLPDAYFNQFDWGELVAILRRCKYFIGNDGGLMHLAACCGTKGKAIFGPSSVAKNKPYSKSMIVVATDYECQPCSLNDKGIAYVAGMIACPYQIRCLYNIKPSAVYEERS